MKKIKPENRNPNKWYRGHYDENYSIKYLTEITDENVDYYKDFGFMWDDTTLKDLIGTENKKEEVK